jgi:hypothetical protein
VPGVALLAAYGAAYYARERSFIFSDLLLALTTVVVLLEARRPGRWKFLLPPVFLVWVNLHAGFSIGLVVITLPLVLEALRLGFRGVRSRARDGAREAAAGPRDAAADPPRRETLRYLACVFAACAACLLNPRGVNGLLYPFQTMFAKNAGIMKHHYLEFYPLLMSGYRHSPSFPVYVVLGCTALALLLLSLKAKPFLETLLFGLFAYLSFSYNRFASAACYVWAAVSVSLLCRHRVLSLGAASARVRSAAVWGFGLFIAAAALTTFRVLDSGFVGKAGTGINADNAPVRAADFLASIGYKGHLFNQHGYGAYLCWAWDGRIKVFWHGAVNDFDFYKSDYLAINRSREDFLRITATYGVDAFLLESKYLRQPRPPLFFGILLEDPLWHLVYLDQASVVFLKETPENAAAIARYSPRSRRRPPATVTPPPG